MGGKQLGFSDYELTTAKKQTKREKFLAEMEAVVPQGQGRLKVCPPSRPGACQHRFRSVDLTAGDARHPFRCSRSAGTR